MFRTPTTGLLCLLLMSTGVFVASAPAHATVFKWAANGHGYEAVLAGRNWQQAQDECVARGGYLATITSDAEDCVVHELFGLNPAFWFVDSFQNGLGPWLGGYQVPGSGEPTGVWEWVTGEPWVYSHWSPSQPDNCCGLNQNRAHFFRPGNTGFGCEWDDAEVSPPGGFIRGYIFETNNPPPDAPVVNTPAGCCNITPTAPKTWGALKQIYR